MWSFKSLGGYYKIDGSVKKVATGGDLQKKVSLEISQNSQENACASLFFNKVTPRQL